MTISDEKIVNALMTSRSKAEAAKKLGCSKTTIYKRFKDDGFIAKMDAANNIYKVMTAVQLLQARESAIACLWEIIEDPCEDTDSRIRASEIVMKSWAGRL